jgi:hypothetical protein
MHKILVRHSQTLPQVYLGLPAQCIQPGAVHELAQGAVGLGGVVSSLAAGGHFCERCGTNAGMLSKTGLGWLPQPACALWGVWKTEW